MSVKDGDRPRAAACGCQPWDAYDLHYDNCMYADVLDALKDLVRINEQWNDAVQAIIGRQPTAFTNYLSRAKVIIQEAEGRPDKERG